MERVSFSERMAKLSFLKKIGYIWDYYKIPLFAIAFALILLGWGIWRLCFPEKQEVLELVLVNANTTEAGLLGFDDLLRENGYDPERNTIRLNASYQVNLKDSSEKSVIQYEMLYARFLGNDLDLVIADEEVFASLASQGAFLDLESLLSEAQKEEYQDRLIYAQVPDLDGKTACGILLEDTALQSEGFYQEKVVGGIPHASGDQELALAVILSLLDE